MIEAPDIAVDEVAFRRAGTEGLPVLAYLYVQLDQAHQGGHTLATATEKLRLILGAGQTATVIEHGGRALGYIVWIDLGDHLFIRHYVVETALRGRGLGGALFARLMAEVLPPTPQIRLEAAAGPATRFWQAQGFQVWSTGLMLDRGTG